jgi:hypothetical protein
VSRLFGMRRGQRRKQGRHCHGVRVIIVRRDPVLLQRVDELTARMAAYDHAWEEYRAARLAEGPPHLRLVRKT